MATTGTARMPGEGECLAQAKAQLMTRDTDTDLWSSKNTFVTVKLLKTSNETGKGDGESQLTAETDLLAAAAAAATAAGASEYRIEGHNVTDGSVIFRCPLSKDFEYFTVNPMFHRWHTDTGRYGVTFQSTSSATEFRRIVNSSMCSVKEEGKLPHESQKTLSTASSIPEVFDQLSQKPLSVRRDINPACTYSWETSIESSSSGRTDSDAQKDILSLSMLDEALPAVPPRRTMRNATPATCEELSRVVPQAQLFKCCNEPGTGTTGSSTAIVHQNYRSSFVDDAKESSESPPVPPRPDLVRSELTWPTGGPKVTAKVQASALTSMQSPFSKVQQSSSLGCCPPAAGATANSTAALNYVYFTENNVPSLSAVNDVKAKTPWSQCPVSAGKHNQDFGRRLDEAKLGACPSDDKTNLGGQYVRLALPQGESVATDGHDYCYPSLDTIISASSSASASQQASANPVDVASRHTPSRSQSVIPPPLPTKSKLSWGDCRKRRKQAQQQRRFASVARLSYGTSSTLPQQQRIGTSHVGSSHLTLDDSMDCQSVDRKRAFRSLLCFLPCEDGSPCPRRRHSRRSHSTSGLPCTVFDDPVTQESVA